MAMPLYIIKAKPCISSNLDLHIIIARIYNLKVDDIRLSAMIYTQKRDYMPLLSQWIKKRDTLIGISFFGVKDG